MNLTIDLGYLLVVGVLYMLWRWRDVLTSRVYAFRARRLHAAMERALRCKIVRVVGPVNDAMVDQWIAAVRAEKVRSQARPVALSSSTTRVRSIGSITSSRNGPTCISVRSSGARRDP